ncbi:hypothetical protein [Nocardiopsis deserti]|uniref:hypothetical protein n=1 Tax=Nocardiopsis deserti TaxID=2605988 RepID=UPI00168121EF|nr:hypothetical protein [Nocardiopsis deserti]
MVFKRWSSFVVSWLLFLFFGLGIFAIGAVWPGVQGLTFESVITLLILLPLSSLLVWFVFNLGVFPGIEVKKDRVVVKEFLGEVEISLGGVSGVEYVGGVQVRLKSGKGIKCTAFPDSLYSLLIGYRNFRGVAASVEKLVNERVGEGGGESEMWAFERTCWNAKALLSISAFYFFAFLVAYLIS